MSFQIPTAISKIKTLPYLNLRLCSNRLFIIGFFILAASPLYAQDSRTSLDSCAIYKLIEQADRPIALSEFKQTPNGINIYSDNLTLQVANFQLCQANHPFSNDKKAIAEFVEFEQTLTKLAEKPITDYLKFDNLSSEQIEQLEQNQDADVYYQEQLVELYLHAAFAHYMGEYVAKDDKKAVYYMSKVVDYYQQVEPEWSTMLGYIVGTSLVREDGYASSNNPITLQHKTETGLGIVSSVLLSRAEHLDTKAALILEALDQWGNAPIPPSQVEIEQYLQPILPKLNRYAEQGSYIATGALHEIYEELALTDSRYKKEADYWQLALKRIPQAEIDWR